MPNDIKLIYRSTNKNRFWWLFTHEAFFMINTTKASLVFLFVRSQAFFNLARSFRDRVNKFTLASNLREQVRTKNRQIVQSLVSSRVHWNVIRFVFSTNLSGLHLVFSFQFGLHCRMNCMPILQRMHEGMYTHLVFTLDYCFNVVSRNYPGNTP